MPKEEHKKSVSGEVDQVIILEMNNDYEMIEKHKLETWSKKVSGMEQVMRKCLDIWKGVRCFNLEG